MDLQNNIQLPQYTVVSDICSSCYMAFTVLASGTDACIYYQCVCGKLNFVIVPSVDSNSTLGSGY